MKNFTEAFGLEFGERSPGSGVELDLSTINANMKGRAMSVQILDDGMNLINEFTMGIGSDGIHFDTAENYYARFVEHFAWSVNARIRLWNLKRKHGSSYFPFGGFSATIREKAIPKQFGRLNPGDLFYMTFTDEFGQSATVSARFALPDSDSGRAKISRRVFRAKVMYHCNY